MSNKLADLKSAHQSVCELLDSHFVGLDLVAHLQELKLSLELQIAALESLAKAETPAE